MPTVEPVDGPQLDRFITALLNLSGIFKQIVEATPEFSVDEPDGLLVVGQAATRARELLDGIEEVYDEEELGYVTHFLALATVVMAQRMGVGDVFRPPGWLN